MPIMLKALVHRLVRWGVLPHSKAPDSAIINIYDEVRHPICLSSWLLGTEFNSQDAFLHVPSCMPCVCFSPQTSTAVAVRSA